MTTAAELLTAVGAELPHVPWWAWLALVVMLFGRFLLPDQPDT